MDVWYPYKKSVLRDKYSIQGLTLSSVPTKGWNAECVEHTLPPGDPNWVVYVTPSMVLAWTPAKFQSCCHVQKSSLSPLSLPLMT